LGLFVKVGQIVLEITRFLSSTKISNDEIYLISVIIYLDIDYFLKNPVIDM